MSQSQNSIYSYNTDKVFFYQDKTIVIKEII